MKASDFEISPLWDYERAIVARQNIFNEIWVDDEYSRYGVDIEVGDVVIDCGANIGMFSKFAIHKGASVVYAYECGEEEYKCLNLNTNQTPNIITTKGYVSDTDYSIKRIIEENKLERIDYLKIDIEGYEYNLLINEDEDVFTKIKKIAIELHIFGMYSGNTEFFYKSFQIIEKLSKLGYKLNLEHIIKNTNLYMLYASK